MHRDTTTTRGAAERRWGARTLACTLAVLAPLGGAVANEVHRPLRVVSFNVFHGGMASERLGDGTRLDERLAMTVDELRALDVDVIGLQEASAGRRRGDVAARLATALGYHHVRAAAGYRWIGRVVTWAVGFDEGPAVVSRFPVESSEAVPLDACGRRYRRVLLCARLATPHGPLDACATHTSNSGCQLRSLARTLRARSRDVPLVLLADLNTAPDRLRFADLLADTGLIDAFGAANPGAPGFTVWQPPWRERRSVSRRVDFVLVRPGAAGLTVRGSRVILDTPHPSTDGRALWPSDHYGVLADLDWPGAAGHPPVERPRGLPHRTSTRRTNPTASGG